MVTEGRRRWGSRCPPLPGGSSDNGAQVEVFGASRLDATARGSAQRSPPASHLPCSSRGCQVLPGCPFNPPPPPPAPLRHRMARPGPLRPAAPSPSRRAPGCGSAGMRRSRVPCAVPSLRRSPYHGCGPRGAGADRERRLRAARPGPAAGISGTAAGGAGRGRAGAAPTAASLLAPAPVSTRASAVTSVPPPAPVLALRTGIECRAPVSVSAPGTVHRPCSVHQCHGPSAGSNAVLCGHWCGVAVQGRGLQYWALGLGHGHQGLRTVHQYQVWAPVLMPGTGHQSGYPLKGDGTSTGYRAPARAPEPGTAGRGQPQHQEATQGIGQQY